MKVVKRGKLAVLSITVMIIVAGYVNYKYNPEREKTLGQTVLVNSEDVKIYEEAKQDIVPKEALYSKEDKGSKLDAFREERETMYSELYTNYNKVITNPQSKEDQIALYQDKLNKLVSEKHLCAMVENIIKSYGIKDAVILKTGENINVVLLTQDGNVKEDAIAKVTMLIKDEFAVNINKISVSVKSEI